MPRPRRTAPGGFVYYVLNRANARRIIFEKSGDYRAFEDTLAHRSAGSGHLYQGRFKSFVVQEDTHFLTVCRYVEGNALRAGLVARAEQWRWCSLRRVLEAGAENAPRLHDWPLPRPSGWTAHVNEAASPVDLDALRQSAQRGTPYGRRPWVGKVAKRLGLTSSLRPRGRPKNGS